MELNIARSYEASGSEDVAQEMYTELASGESSSRNLYTRDESHLIQEYKDANGDTIIDRVGGLASFERKYDVTLGMYAQWRLEVLEKSITK